MKSAPDQLDLFAPEPAPGFELAEPSMLKPPRHPQREDGADEAFHASVRAFGVLNPLLVVEEEDGRHAIVSGARRAAAAAAAGQRVPIRVLSCSRIEALCAALSADEHVQPRSTIEQGWRFAEILASAELDGTRVTVRWVAKHLGVSQGKAHGLISVARSLTPGRVEFLATQAGVHAARVRSLPFHEAVRLALTKEDEASVKLLQQRFRPVTPSRPSSTWWTRVLDWVRGLLPRILTSLSNARGSP